MSIEFIRIHGPEKLRNGCQKMGVDAERGLENAVVTTCARLCEIGREKYHKRKKVVLFRVTFMGEESFKV